MKSLRMIASTGILMSDVFLLQTGCSEHPCSGVASHVCEHIHELKSLVDLGVNNFCQAYLNGPPGWLSGQ